MRDLFRHFSRSTSEAVGSPWAFVIATAVIIIWAVTGPLFGFSDTWQLVINTGTTIITFLMVFLIQNTQNRDSRAMHIKLDELIRASKARNDFVDVENMSDADLDRFDKEFENIAQTLAAARAKRGLKEKFNTDRNQEELRKARKNIQQKEVERLGERLEDDKA
jgi:low affinity Fe/Cu permease